MPERQPAKKDFENVVHEDTTSTDAEKDLPASNTNGDDQIPRTSSKDATTEVENAKVMTSSPDSRSFSWFMVVISTLSRLWLSTLGKFAWLSDGFTIGSVATLTILFMVGSALCGAAPKLNAFIIGRVIAGVGCNGIDLGVMALLSVKINDRERPMYSGLCGLTFGIGMVLGPLVGGSLAQSSATWRWGFYLNLCVGGLFSPIWIFILPGFDPRGSQSFLSRIGEFEYLGAILSIAVTVCLIAGSNFCDVVYTWNSGQIIAFFVLGSTTCIAFALQQVFTFSTKVEHRMFPVSFLKDREAVLLFVLLTTCNAGGFIPVHYIPPYFQFARAEDPLSSAVRLIPLIIFISVMVLVNGVLTAKWGYYQPWYTGGSKFALVGAVLFSTITTTTSTARIYGYQVLLGIGAGAYAQVGYAVIQAVVEPAMMAYAIGFMILAQQCGIALGLSVAGAVFVNPALGKFVSGNFFGHAASRFEKQGAHCAC